MLKFDMLVYYRSREPRNGENPLGVKFKMTDCDQIFTEI